ncbi:hypothetical protein Pcinc_043876 [Petrolisthes cinctipes]|uniref:Uncharacterized protein n=1 Tax=Petrolisthes cinctipes TaxID=88211 RepID=A0AAE1BFT1_PETCI|nr:hypothetical protein Pcinc_043876 [Petrolisthes cinctipes]
MKGNVMCWVCHVSHWAGQGRTPVACHAVPCPVPVVVYGGECVWCRAARCVWDRCVREVACVCAVRAWRDSAAARVGAAPAATRLGQLLSTLGVEWHGAAVGTEGHSAQSVSPVPAAPGPRAPGTLGAKHESTSPAAPVTSLQPHCLARGKPHLPPLRRRPHVVCYTPPPLPSPPPPCLAARLPAAAAGSRPRPLCDTTCWCGWHFVTRCQVMPTTHCHCPDGHW